MPAPRLDRMQEYLKPIVYGGNDGIVTTFAIVAGFAGAGADGVAGVWALAVLVFGLANLFADAVSMGLGEFLSARSAADLHAARRTAIDDRIRQNPAAAEGDLRAILHQRGLPPDAAAEAARAVIGTPEAAAALILAWGENLPDPAQDNPAANGVATTLSFMVFGILPLVPYLLRPADQLSLQMSVGFSLLALFALGVLRWRATGGSALRAVAETMLVGSICGGVAFGVGWIVVS